MEGVEIHTVFSSQNRSKSKKEDASSSKQQIVDEEEIDLTIPVVEQSNVLETAILQDWLHEHTHPYSSSLPKIPLCLLEPFDAARANLDDMSTHALYENFKRHGYLENLGNFIVSDRLLDGTILEISDEDKERKKGTIWGNVCEQFEEELAKSTHWRHLSKRKFVVWDGNHRLQAWLACIMKVNHYS